MSARAATMFAIFMICWLTLFFTAVGAIVAGVVFFINETPAILRVTVFFGSVAVLFVCGFLGAYALPRLMDLGIKWDLDDRRRM